MTAKSPVTLRNINPLGEVELPLVGRVLAAGEEFEVPAEVAERLLEQVGNYEAVKPKPSAKQPKG